MPEGDVELLEIADRLDHHVKRAEEASIKQVRESLQAAADDVGKAWSESWLGYQAYVYYANLRPPPPGAHFSVEWGFQQLHTIPTTNGDWREFDPDEVEREVRRRGGNPDLTVARRAAEEASTFFGHARSDVLSILETELAGNADNFLDVLKSQAEKLSIEPQSAFVTLMHPKGTVMSRDAVAMGQGFKTPPHMAVLAEALWLGYPSHVCADLRDIARRAGSHLGRKKQRIRKSDRVGTNVFIGHGRSPVWRDLKDFVQDRLQLPWDEFNRVPVAGVTNITRLSEMMDAAAIAFLVMTGEDEKIDGATQARANVIHEAGLFQGRLGFGKAIVLLEDGCQEFSNLAGLGQIRFPKGDIKPAFEEIRRVLEREGIIKGA